MQHLASASVGSSRIPGTQRAERSTVARSTGRHDATPLPRPELPAADFDLARATSVRALPPVPSIAVPPIPADRIVPPRPGPDLAGAVDPSPSVLCAALSRCVVEVLAGARSLDQVARWVTDAVYVHLLRRNMLAQRARKETPDSTPRPRIHIGDPRLSSPKPDVIEAVVMVHQPARSRAVAIRLERHRSRWRASAINVL